MKKTAIEYDEEILGILEYEDNELREMSDEIDFIIANRDDFEEGIADDRAGRIRNELVQKFHLIKEASFGPDDDGRAKERLGLAVRIEENFPELDRRANTLTMVVQKVEEKRAREAMEEEQAKNSQLSR